MEWNAVGMAKIRAVRAVLYSINSSLVGTRRALLVASYLERSTQA